MEGSEIVFENTCDNKSSLTNELIAGLRTIEGQIGRSELECKTNEYFISENTHIPQLAWLVKRSEAGFECTVGKAVEVFEKGFFEGVWAGDFSDFSSALDAETFGSGVYFGVSGPTFIQRKDVREFTFILRNLESGEIYFSNSLPYALAAANVQEDDPFLTELDQVLVQSTLKEWPKGFYGMNPLVAKSNSIALYRICYANFTVQRDGSIDFIKNFKISKFSEYSDYKSYLLNVISSVFENGANSKRKVPLKPLTSISRGYDSVAVAALAAQCGCEEAVTLRVRGDNGRRIGRALGMKVHSFKHILINTVTKRFIKRKRLLIGELDSRLKERAYEFIASAGIGDDIVLASFESVLGGKVFLSGTGGDDIWDKDAKPNLGMKKTIAQNASLTEFRLRVGFAHFTPILCGSLSTQSVVDLSNSSEMLPFSVGGSYDRPIARRIAEEAGIGRAAFGRKKKAQNPYFTNSSNLWRESVLAIMRRYAAHCD